MRSLHSYLVNGVCRGFIRTGLLADIDVLPLRRRAIEMSRKLRLSYPGVRWHDSHIEGLPARWFEPDHGYDHQVILYLHGGAFVFPWFVLHEQFCAHLARKTGATVVMPDYRLAPDHLFPAAPDDCIKAYRWLLRQGYPAENLVIAGDSAGGNLSLVTLMQARDEGLPMPSCGVLISPLTDFCFRGRSMLENDGKDPMFIASATSRMTDLYVPEGQDLVDYRLSPVHHSFRGLPPLRFFAGSTEILRDDSSLAAARAREDGVDAMAYIASGMPHVYPLVHYLPEARRSARKIVDFMRDKLQGNSSLPLARAV